MAKITVTFTIRNLYRGDEVAIAKILNEALVPYVERKLKQSEEVKGKVIVANLSVIAGEDR